ncbi:MAG: non-ribosomal peptide synthetase, partial [Ktedonobacteraceae bacterium]|nr:non-ribosomal peptide synthetase [Ktedonobacteraceae bacterium]
MLPFEQGPATDAKGYDSYTQQRMTFSSEFTAQLQTVARQLQITLNTLLQGAWALLLSHYSGNRDVLYGTTVAGRPTHLPGSDHMVGLFINTLPMRVCVPPAAYLADWLKMLQAQQAIIQQYDYCSLVQMQGWSDIPRNFPLFKSLFVFENYPTRAVGLSTRTQGQLSAERLSSTGQTNYPLTIVVEPATTLSLQVIYACDHFSSEAIERLLGHLLTILTGFVDQPHRPLGDMAYLT